MLFNAGKKCYYKSLTSGDTGYPSKASLPKVISLQASIVENNYKTVIH